MSPTDHPPYLDATDILSAFDPSDQAEICSQFDKIALKRGDVLVRQGRPAKTLYVVVTGRFVVTKNGINNSIAEIGPGQPIGEIAFLTGAPRTATVTALRDSVVLRLETETFECLCRNKPELWRAMSQALASRVAATTSDGNQAPDPRPSTITLIPAGGAKYADGFVDGLIAALQDTGQVCVLNANNIVEKLGMTKDFTSDEGISALNNLEAKYDILLFITDPTLSQWSRRAIRQADLVLSVARFNSDRTVNPLEQFAAEMVPSRDRRLVLHHRRRRLFRGTANWLSERDPFMHHHVALNNPEDFARLVRFIQGRAIGLVACGGGALCSAHVGAFKALQNSGVEFDAMGGTSAGSAMVGAFALGTEPEEVDHAVEDIFIRNKAMGRYNWPRYSLLNHGNFDHHLSRYFAGYDIQDLWIPFFSVSTNLSRSASEVHRTGDLFHAVRASSSIPVLLPPVYNDSGEMLVDGCLLDNLPITTMHEFKTGPNIVINFEPPKQERFDVNYSELPSGLELIKCMINPLARQKLQDAPSVINVLMRSLMASRSDFSKKLRTEDILLIPPIPEDAGFLDWDRSHELNRIAFDWTTEELENIASGEPSWLKTIVNNHTLLTPKPGTN